MHEEMHMTQMQFTNTGARETVSFLDTTSRGSKVPQRMYLKR